MSVWVLSGWSRAWSGLRTFGSAPRACRTDVRAVSDRSLLIARLLIRDLCHQYGPQLDFRAGQGLRDRASLLGGLSLFQECFLIDAWDLRLGLQLNGGDLEAIAYLVKMNPGGRVDAFWMVARLSQH